MRTFSNSPYKTDFLLKKSHILLSNFQSILFLLLRVSGRKIGQVNKSIVFSYPTTERSMIGTHLYDLAISFNDSSVADLYLTMRVTPL